MMPGCVAFLFLLYGNLGSNNKDALIQSAQDKEQFLSVRTDRD